MEIRDEAHRLIGISGAASLGRIINVAVGDSWFLLACVDRLVELGEIREITGGNVASQDRVFVSARVR